MENLPPEAPNPASSMEMTMSKTVFIAGGRGTVGEHLANRLRLEGHTVRAGSRRPHGPFATTFDYTDPQSFPAALEGVDAAYLVVPEATAQPLELVSPFVDAAASAGVKLVLQSAMGVDANDAIPLRQLELRIEAAGVPYVLLRPNWFFDNLHGRWFTSISRAGQLALPAEAARTSFVDARDIADVAFVALTRPLLDGRALVLTGAEPLTYAETTAALAALTGISIGYRSIDDDEFVSRAAEIGITPDFARQMVPIFAAVRNGWLAQVSPHVAEILGRAPRRLRDYLLDSVWRFESAVARSRRQALHEVSQSA
jgi:uncharacterized protein YbjT (DUF2867 family)